MKSILDSAQFKSSSAWALYKAGKSAGKVIWTWGKEGFCRCSIILFNQESGKFNGTIQGTAGGYGYDKRPAAFEDCLDKNGVDAQVSDAERYLIDLGYEVFIIF